MIGMPLTRGETVVYQFLAGNVYNDCDFDLDSRLSFADCPVELYLHGLSKVLPANVA